MTTDIETPEVEEIPDGFRQYTVVAAAVTILTGEEFAGKKVSTRLTKGDRLNADPSNESIRTLLGFRSIIPTSKLADGRERVTTARTIFDLGKQTGEATAAMDKGVVPINAPVDHEPTV